MSTKFIPTQQIYDQYASEFVVHFEKRQNEIEISRFLSQLPAHAYILDAGCGTAVAAALFKERGYQVLGIDLSKNLLKEAQKFQFKKWI